MISSPSAPPQTSLGKRDPQPSPPKQTPPKYRGWWIAAGVIVLLAGGGAILVPRLATRGLEQELTKLTVPATIQDLTTRLRVSGKVQPVRQVNVSPRESGRMIALYVDQGDQVQAGQLLARMDYGNLTGSLTQAQGRIVELQARLREQQAGEQIQVRQTAQAKVAAAQSRLDLAQKELDRTQPLVAAGALRRSDLDSKIATRDQAQADLAAAQFDLRRLQAGTRLEQLQQTQAQIQQARGTLEQQQARINDTEIRAPFAGLVIQRYADIGAFVAPTTSASDATAATSSSILSLADGIEIRAEVPEAQISSVSVGQPVDIRPVALPDQVIPGTVSKIAPATVVVKEVTIFYVTIKPTDANNLLRSGMNVSVDFVGAPQTNLLTVPSVALIYTQGKQGVILWDPQQRQPVYRLVKVGITQSGVTQILEGLQEKDAVFTALPPGRTLQSFTGVDTGPDVNR